MDVSLTAVGKERECSLKGEKDVMTLRHEDRSALTTDAEPCFFYLVFLPSVSLQVLSICSLALVSQFSLSYTSFVQSSVQ